MHTRILPGHRTSIRVGLVQGASVKASFPIRQSILQFISYWLMQRTVTLAQFVDDTALWASSPISVVASRTLLLLIPTRLRSTLFRHPNNGSNELWEIHLKLLPTAIYLGIIFQNSRRNSRNQVLLRYCPAA